MKNVLITGGTGFLGANLASVISQQGYNVRILRRPSSDLRAVKDLRLEHFLGDIRDPDSLRNALQGCDTVFHTAAVVSFKQKDRELQHEVNVAGTRNVVEACLASRVERLVHTSSVATIGPVSEGELASEETPYKWGAASGYRYTKYLAEQEVYAGISQGLDAVIMNPSVIVGERDIHFHGGQMIREVKRGFVPFYIHGGMNVVYVGDVVQGHIQAALQGKRGERYILSGENLTHREIFKRTATLVGGKAPFAKLPIPLVRAGAVVIERVSRILGIEPLITPDLVSGAGRRNWFTCEKANAELGYRVTPFDQAILAAYHWYTSNGLL
jgi:dihydroflavonol-4-reductase